MQEDQKGLDHVVVVDAGNDIVRDWEKEYGLNMDLSVLDHCVDEDAKFCVVTRLNQLDVLSTEKRGWKPR